MTMNTSLVPYVPQTIGLVDRHGVERWNFPRPQTSLERLPYGTQVPQSGGGLLSIVNQRHGYVWRTNAAAYRAWSEASPWVRAAIDIRRDQVSSAEWDIVPYDKDGHSDNKRVARRVKALLESPNADDTFFSYVQKVVEDILVLDGAPCLWGHSRVLLPDGTQMPIGQIVNKHLDIEVMAFDRETQALCPRRVTGWHRNKVGNRKWAKVNYKHSRDMGRHGKRATWFTDDHPLLTEFGWRPVSGVGTAKVVTSARQPNAKARELFDGTMLGDAGLSGHPLRRSLAFGHCERQSEWALLKASSVGFGMKMSTRDACVSPAVDGRGVMNATAQVRYRSDAGPWLQEQTERWYRPTKIVPRDLVLTDLALAAWFMDDGHRAITHDKNGYKCEVSYFNSHGFSVGDQQFLVDLLRARGIKANLQADGKHTRIYVSAMGTRALFSAIGRFVPPPMRYKVGPSAPEFDADEWTGFGDEPYLDTVEIVYGNPTGGKNKVPTWSYCIDVEDDHNFVTSDLIAHNCEKVRYPNGEIAELYPVAGEFIALNSRWDGSDEDQIRYLYVPDGTVRAQFTNADMVYFMQNPRTNSVIGLPPLEVLKQTVDAELKAMEYNRRMVMGSPPEGILDIGELATPTDVTSAKSEWDSTILGQSAFAIIGGYKNPQWLKFRDTNQEMQFREWQDYLVRQIAVVFALSPQDLGITFDVNRSTSEVQSDNTDDRGLKPLLQLIQERITQEIVWDESFGGRAVNLKFVFTSLNLKESMARASINKIAMGGVSWKSVNEARIMDGRAPMGDPTDEKNPFNCILAVLPKGLMNITTGKYVGEEDLAQTMADSQIDIEQAKAEARAANPTATQPVDTAVKRAPGKGAAQ
jgi:phage portal protein BeeE